MPTVPHTALAPSLYHPKLPGSSMLRPLASNIPAYRSASPSLASSVCSPRSSSAGGRAAQRAEACNLQSTKIAGLQMNSSAADGHVVTRAFLDQEDLQRLAADAYDPTQHQDTSARGTRSPLLSPRHGRFSPANLSLLEGMFSEELPDSLTTCEIRHRQDNASPALVATPPPAQPGAGCSSPRSPFHFGRSGPAGSLELEMRPRADAMAEHDLLDLLNGNLDGKTESNHLADSPTEAMYASAPAALGSNMADGSGKIDGEVLSLADDEIAQACALVQGQLSLATWGLS